jgi:hypothetical protein
MKMRFRFSLSLAASGSRFAPAGLDENEAGKNKKAAF